MQKYFLVIRIYKYRIVSMLLLFILLVIGLRLINNTFNPSNQKIDYEYAYYSGNDSDELISKLTNDVTYEMGMPLIYEKTEQDKFDYTVIDELDNTVDLSSLKYLDSTNEELITANRNNVINGIVELSFSLKYLDLPDFVIEQKVNIPSANLFLIAGDLPSQDEIIIPESYALSLLNGEGSLNDVLGDEVELKQNEQKKTYIVSGITSTENFYTTDEEIGKYIADEVESNQKGLYIKFPNKSAKKEFIDANTEYNIIDNRAVKKENLITYILLILKIIAVININLYLISLAYKVNQRISYYSDEKLMLVKLLIIPVLFCNVIIIFI